jgi:GxxExxY protein
MLNDKIDNELTEKIIGAFYKVYNTLGFGYLEKVYENAMLIELRKHGLKVEAQKPIRVYYEGQLVGEYFADLFVNDIVLIELKTTSSISVENESQLFNYLKATNTEIGLLLNFGPQATLKRKLWTPDRRKHQCQSVESAKSV